MGLDVYKRQQQNDGNLVALDAKTGAKVWSVLVNDPKVGATNTNAPHVIKDKVLTGCSGAEFGVRCFIAAYNLKAVSYTHLDVYKRQQMVYDCIRT